MNTRRGAVRKILVPGDLVRYRKEFEYRSEYETGGLLVGVVVDDISQGQFDDPEEQMLHVLFGDSVVFMFGKELELFEDISTGDVST